MYIILEFIYDIIDNKAIFVPVLAWFCAQGFKIVWKVITSKEVKLSWFVSSGGMPSSHSAFIVSMATVIGKNYGWYSGEFGIAFSVALIVMYDAAGVRRAAGKQAKILNKLILNEEFNSGESLKELIGHSPVEVLIGAVLGVILGLVLG